MWKKDGRQIEQNHKPKNTSMETGNFYLVTVDIVILHRDRPPGVSHFTEQDTGLISLALSLKSINTHAIFHSL